MRIGRASYLYHFAFSHKQYVHAWETCMSAWYDGHVHAYCTWLLFTLIAVTWEDVGYYNYKETAMRLHTPRYSILQIISVH